MSISASPIPLSEISEERFKEFVAQHTADLEKAGITSHDRNELQEQIIDFWVHHKDSDAAQNLMTGLKLALGNSKRVVFENLTEDRLNKVFDDNFTNLVRYEKDALIKKLQEKDKNNLDKNNLKKPDKIELLIELMLDDNVPGNIRGELANLADLKKEGVNPDPTPVVDKAKDTKRVVAVMHHGLPEGPKYNNVLLPAPLTMARENRGEKPKKEPNEEDPSLSEQGNVLVELAADMIAEIIGRKNIASAFYYEPSNRTQGTAQGVAKRLQETGVITRTDPEKGVAVIVVDETDPEKATQAIQQQIAALPSYIHFVFIASHDPETSGMLVPMVGEEEASKQQFSPTTYLGSVPKAGGYVVQWDGQWGDINKVTKPDNLTTTKFNPQDKLSEIVSELNTLTQPMTILGKNHSFLADYPKPDKGERSNKPDRVTNDSLLHEQLSFIASDLARPQDAAELLPGVYKEDRQGYKRYHRDNVYALAVTIDAVNRFERGYQQNQTPDNKEAKKLHEFACSDEFKALCRFCELDTEERLRSVLEVKPKGHAAATQPEHAEFEALLALYPNGTKPDIAYRGTPVSPANPFAEKNKSPNV